MERSEKSDGEFCVTGPNIWTARGRAPITHSQHLILLSVVEFPYTTPQAGPRFFHPRKGKDNAMAFVRRKGNAYYLVHNVRHGGKVRQLHLARLGDRARITDEIVKEVSRKHPFIDLNWRTLREQLQGRIDIADPQSPAVVKLIETLRTLNLDLADVIPQMLRLSESPAVARELLVQMRLLHTTIQVKLDQFDSKEHLKRLNRTSGRYGSVSPEFQGR
ncbi:MAG TPA: hypothetical protein VKB48_17910 [Candidatus Acidoferrum sp.]|nr:hypothetical protein [Candidatus Acidoferrum sp.]